MLPKLPIDKFAEGFVIECEVLGVDPAAVVKVAQVINTKIPGHGERFETFQQQNPMMGGVPGMSQKVNPVTQGMGQLANIGELGTGVRPTGRSAQGQRSLAQINTSRKQRGLKPLTAQQGAPMARRTGAEQFSRELAAVTPGASLGRNLDVAGQRFRESTKGKRKYSPEWWAQAVKHYGKGIGQTILPTEAIGEYIESGRRGYQRFRGELDPEYKKQLEREEEQRQLGELETGLSEQAQEEEYQQQLAQRRMGHSQRRMQLQFDRKAREWEAAKAEAAEAGEDMEAWEDENPRPKKPSLQWGPADRRRKVRMKPLMGASPLYRRELRRRT